MEHQHHTGISNLPPIKLIGEDGNAFSILGRCRRAMKEQYRNDGISTEEFLEAWSRFETEATSGDYDHLLQTVMQWFQQ